jgi:signal transduction histidine kinase
MRRPAPPGPLRDAWVMLPVALVLLLVLSSFTLLSYRNGVRLLLLERQQEALTAARRAAKAVGGGELPPVGELHDFHPAALRLALADADGQLVAAVGEPLDGPFTAPLHGAALRDPAAAGPGGAAGPVAAAFVPLGGSGRQGRWLRLDLASPALAGQRRVLGILTWTGLGASAAVLLWLLLFLRQLLRPYETLLRRARELGGATPEDEASFLLATVERALGGHGGEPGRPERSEELAVLERTLAANLESGLLLLDRDGRVLVLNPAGATLLGPPPPPRTPVAELLAGQPELLGLLHAAMAAGEGLQRQECDVFAGGETRRIGLTATPLRRPDGELLGYLVLFADLTSSEREGHQARLAESLAHLGELAAGVAHELRNGLATLGGYLTLLERDPSGSHAADYLTELRGETLRLQRVVTDFLGFAHPGAAQLTAVDLVALVRHAAADPALDGAGLRLIDDEAGPAVLPGDPQLLERALRNLLRNAREAQERQGAAGAVEVETGWRDDRFEIAIRDRGPGVSAEMRRRLFQPFASDRPGGVGLGLALAHRIVSLHGGTLVLEPRPEGGTTARISFARERFEAR